MLHTHATLVGWYVACSTAQFSSCHLEGQRAQTKLLHGGADVIEVGGGDAHLLSQGAVVHLDL